MLVWKVLPHRYSGWDYRSNRLISQWFNQIFLSVVTLPLEASHFFSSSLALLLPNFLFFASLMGIKWFVLICTHLIPRNLGNFFIYLSAFLVSLSVNCSFLFAHFAMGISCVVVLQSCSYIPGQLQITLRMALKFVYLGVSFPKKKFLILM